MRPGLEVMMVHQWICNSADFAAPDGLVAGFTTLIDILLQIFWRLASVSLNNVFAVHCIALDFEHEHLFPAGLPYLPRGERMGADWRRAPGPARRTIRA